MSVQPIEVARPERWDHPLSPSMLKEDVDWLLRQAPFSHMDQQRFAHNTPLAAVLQNDARLLHLNPGDVIFREGQYGGSAYLVLTGDVRIFLTRLLIRSSANAEPGTRDNWLKLLAKTIPLSRRRSPAAMADKRRHARADIRPSSSVDQSSPPAADHSAADHPAADHPAAQPAALGYRGEGSQTRIFLQDVPRVLEDHATSTVQPGELFGEMAAVTRSPREYTAVAETETILLEIRWQGLKLLKQDPAFGQLLDERYRSEILRNHLRETMLFRFIPEESLQHVVAAARLESFGNLEWYAEYRQGLKQPARERLAAEPLMAEEGSYALGLWIVRGGFARLSRRQGAGHRTLAYLSKGQMFGLRELAHNFHHGPNVPLPYQESLRAIGYVDALCIPKQIVNEHILPFVRQADLPEPLSVPRYQFDQPIVDAPLETNEHNVDTGLLEFLVDQRLMNGRQAMVIDTERCTRCDDCVRACAKTHHGTPVFVRGGPQYGPWMFAQACMHCEDPVCMIGCPTGAIHRDHDTGLVQINAETCIGCKTCAESCPYDNIRMVPTSDSQGRARVDQTNGLPILLASKCDLCADRNGPPACQSACPHDALVRIDLSDISQLSHCVQRKAG